MVQWCSTTVKNGNIENTFYDSIWSRGSWLHNCAESIFLVFFVGSEENQGVSAAWKWMVNMFSASPSSRAVSAALCRGRIRKRVFQICSTYGAFAATKAATWRQLRQILPTSSLSCRYVWALCLHSNWSAYSEDGSVVTWGDADWGGDSSAVQNELYMVASVCGTFRAFLELHSNGTFFLGDDAPYLQQVKRGMLELLWHGPYHCT